MKDNKYTKKEEKIIEKANKAISELVYEKDKLRKAYNYYHGKRDTEQFTHLEDNYGLGTPTAVEFVPLIRKHIDVLVGEYLSTPVIPKVSCKDKETLSNIFREKQLQIASEVKKLIEKHLIDAIGDFDKKVQDKIIIEQVEELKRSLDENFISQYEIAGQNIVEYSMQSRNIDFLNKVKMIITDLLISGTCYYKVVPTKSKTNIDLVVLNPLYTYIEKNQNSPYHNRSERGVCKLFYTKQQILANYGDLLSKDDLDELDDKSNMVEKDFFYIQSAADSIDIQGDGILGGLEISPINHMDSIDNYRTYPVYEVEYVETKEINGEWITNRQEVVRIGENIFIIYGESEYVTRTMDDPNNCNISINGMFHADRNGEPISLILSTANLQDKYDILCFFRDNLIATSGTVGDWIDVAHLPKFLGSDVAERLMKWEGYAKNGKKLYDSSQEGEVINTSFTGFDDTIKVQSIQGIELAITRIEETASTITGVFRERLGGIEQKDAVTNVQVGIKNSSLITKQYYQVMDLITREILLDIINLSKIVYTEGITGTLILGERLNRIFTALPKYYTITDFDIHITNSSDIIMEQENIKMWISELIKNGNVDPRIIAASFGSKSITAMKRDFLNAFDKQKSENDQLGQLSSQVEQLDKALKDSNKQAEQLQKQIEQLDAEKLAIERQKQESDEKIRWFEAKSKDEVDRIEAENDKMRVQLEGLQLLDENKNNDEVRNN